ARLARAACCGTSAANGANEKVRAPRDARTWLTRACGRLFVAARGRSATRGRRRRPHHERLRLRWRRQVERRLGTGVVVLARRFAARLTRLAVLLARRFGPLFTRLVAARLGTGRAFAARMFLALRATAGGLQRVELAFLGRGFARAGVIV